MTGKWKMFLVSVLISFGGSFHFGYQLSSVNPSETVFRRFVNESHFSHYNRHLTDTEYRVIWSVILSLSAVADLIGSVFLVPVAEKLGGRKRSFYFSSVIMTFGFLMQAASKWANSFELFACARFVVGMSEGWTVSIQCMYLSECSPKQWRGLCGGVTGAIVELGLVLGAIIMLPTAFGTDTHWPFAYMLEILLMFIAWFTMIFLHESPKYLISRGRVSEAKRSMHFFLHTDVEESMCEIVEEIDSQKGRASLKELCSKPHLRRAVFLGICVWFVSTFSGIEAIDFFSTHLFQQVGFTLTEATYATVGITCQALLSALVSGFILDRFGRRPLLLTTTAGLALFNALFMIFALLYNAYGNIAYGYTCVAVQILWVFCFGVGPAVLQWTVTSELVPQNARSSVMALINAINLLVVTVMRLAFFPLHGVAGAYSFLMFIIPLVIIGIMLCFTFPETKNRSTVDIMRDLGYRKK